VTVASVDWQVANFALNWAQLALTVVVGYMLLRLLADLHSAFMEHKTRTPVRAMRGLVQTLRSGAERDGLPIHVRLKVYEALEEQLRLLEAELLPNPRRERNVASHQGP
jgi:hypothetical protein